MNGERGFTETHMGCLIGSRLMHCTGYSFLVVAETRGSFLIIDGNGESVWVPFDELDTGRWGMVS